MSRNWMRRGLLALASFLALASIVACGDSVIESQLRPTRVVSFGDAFSDLGQGGTRYTVNDNTANIWTQVLAAAYGLNLVKSSGGGTSYAVGNARVTIKPDAAGNASTRTITEQIDAFIAGGGA